jgi:hypothetical protein
VCVQGIVMLGASSRNPSPSLWVMASRHGQQGIGDGPSVQGDGKDEPNVRDLAPDY